MKEAIILAGGFGTRLQHVVSDVPKPMAPINGVPFLSILMDYLMNFDFEHVVLSTGYLHEKIESFYGKQYKKLRISYAQELNPLGTGGGMLNALQHCQNEEVVVLNGDTFFAVDYNKFETFHNEHDTMLSIVLRSVEDTSRYGSVQIDEQNKITLFNEKNVVSGEGLINGGIYLINKHLFDSFAIGQRFSFEKDLMEVYYQKYPFYAMLSDVYFIDIGIPEDYARAQRECQLFQYKKL